MENKKGLKNNRKKIIIGVIVLVALILLIIFTVGVINYLMPNTKESVYGDRCETTEKYPIATERKEKLEEFLKDYNNIKLVSFNVKCNLIDIIIEVDDDENFSKVKEMGKKMLSIFDENEIKYYDIELMVRSTKKDSDAYPQLGTHHKEINGSTNDDFIW